MRSNIVMHSSLNRAGVGEAVILKSVLFYFGDSSEIIFNVLSATGLQLYMAMCGAQLILRDEQILEKLIFILLILNETILCVSFLAKNSIGCLMRDMFRCHAVQKKVANYTRLFIDKLYSLKSCPF